MAKSTVPRKSTKCPFWCFIVLLLISEVVGLVYRGVVLRVVENIPEIKLFGGVGISSRHLQITTGVLLMVFVLWVYYCMCKYVAKRKNSSK